MANCILVSYEPTDNVDTSVLIVGKKTAKKDVDIIDAFQGTEAIELWNKLTMKKETEK